MYLLFESTTFKEDKVKIVKHLVGINERLRYALRISFEEWTTNASNRIE